MPCKSTPIADQLRQIIHQAERQGITRYQLAKRSGVSEGQLSRLVHGEVSPRLDSADRIAKALGYRFHLTEQ